MKWLIGFLAMVGIITLAAFAVLGALWIAGEIEIETKEEDED